MTTNKQSPVPGRPTIEAMRTPFGAVVRGLRLGEIDSEIADALHRRLNEHQLLVIHPADPGACALPVLCRHFGQVMAHGFGLPLGETGGYHSPTTWRADLTHLPNPPTVGMARYDGVAGALPMPTVWASLSAAHEGLGPHWRERLGRLDAIHSSRGAHDTRADVADPTVTHPLVRALDTHRRCGLFFNTRHVRRVGDLSDDVSRAFAVFLSAHIARASLRLDWQPGTVLIWDNRAVVRQLDRAAHAPNVEWCVGAPRPVIDPSTAAHARIGLALDAGRSSASSHCERD